MHPFEKSLLVSAEESAFELRGHVPVPWANFWLNPRRLRGSDFLMRWSQGYWSEQRLIEAVAQTGRYFALPYGPSGVAPTEVRAFELYLEELEAAGLGRVKRPDLLVFRASDADAVAATVDSLGGTARLPFTSESAAPMRELLDRALIAIECENSLWVAKRMPDYDRAMTPQRRLGGQLGLKKSAVLPTVIVKEEDRAFLRRWQQERAVPIHIWHAFFDSAWGLSLDRAEELIETGLIEPTFQVFQAPGGATTKKAIYKFYYHYAYPLGEMEQEPQLRAERIEDKNGHILPYVRFEGGRMRLLPDALGVLDKAAIQP